MVDLSRKQQLELPTRQSADYAMWRTIEDSLGCLLCVSRRNYSANLATGGLWREEDRQILTVALSILATAPGQSDPEPVCENHEDLKNLEF